MLHIRMLPLLASWLVLSLASSTLAQHELYVRSSDSSPRSCPRDPCFTLVQYVQQGTHFTSGSTFVFLAGNHSIHTAISLMHTSGIALRGENGSIPYILCGNATTTCIRCENVSNLRIERLAFILNPSTWFNEPSDLEIRNSTERCLDTQFVIYRKWLFS